MGRSRIWKPTRGAQVDRSHPLARGLVGCWLFNEGTGDKVFDISGYGNHGNFGGGTPSYAPSWVPGRAGSALDFDGTDDYVSVSDDESLDITDSISAEFWFKTSQSATAWSDLVRHDGHFTALQLMDTGNGRSVWWIGGTFYTLEFSWTYNDNIWHHYVATYNSVNGAKIYIDSDLIATNTANVGTLDTSTKIWVIGASETLSFYFNGAIDEVRIYNRVLSAAEVAWLYRDPYCFIRDPLAEMVVLSGTTRTWDNGSGDGLWSTAQNWSGDTVPGPLDDVVFDSTSTDACTIDTAVSVVSISVNSSYTGTITQNANVSVGGNFSCSAGTWAVGTYNLAVTGNSTVSGGTVTIGASTSNGWTTTDLTIGTDGTVTCSGASKITLTGSWDSTNGTYNYSTETATFRGTGQSDITGNTTFYNLTIDTSADGAKTVRFGANSTQTVTGTLILTGHSGKILTVQSTSVGTQATIDIPGNITSGVDYVDVKDNKINGQNHKITAGSNCVNSGNNTNWLFGTVKPVAVGSNPYGVACDETAGKTFVANNGPNAVSVIHTASNTLSATISIGTNPIGVDCYEGEGESEGKVFVANNGDNTVSVIHTASNTVSATISVGSNPYGLACDETAGKVFVANNGPNTVSVIHTASNTVSATISVGTNPIGIACDETAGKVFVTNNGSNTVSVIHTASGTVSATISVGTNPYGVACDESAGKVFVANNADNTVSVIHTASNTVSATISVGTNPYGVACDETAYATFIVNNALNTVSVIHTPSNTVSTTISVGANPSYVGCDETQELAFVSNVNDDTVSVVSDYGPLC